MASAAPAAPQAVWADTIPAHRQWFWLPSRVYTFCLVEWQKLRHDRTELLTRAIQPVLWLVIFGKTFSHIHAISTPNGVPYLDYLTPGVLAQSTLFVAVFYGIQVIWERDAGVLSKLMVTPTPRSALVLGKGFAASVRAAAQVIVVIVVALLIGVHLKLAPWRIIGSMAAVALGAAFFACLSVTVAGLVLSRERLMGIGQAITMPLFFASNALYPIALMPVWLQWVSRFNPLTYQVNALRGFLLGFPAHYWVDFGVLTLAVALAVTVAATVLPRLVR